jgi:hypothetical protein
VDEIYGRKTVRWCTINLTRYWNTVIGPKVPEEKWSPPSDEAREMAWSGLEKQERAEVRACLGFIRDRDVTLSASEREELLEWIKAGEVWEAREKERERSQSG